MSKKLRNAIISLLLVNSVITLSIFTKDCIKAGNAEEKAYNKLYQSYFQCGHYPAMVRSMNTNLILKGVICYNYSTLIENHIFCDICGSPRTEVPELVSNISIMLSQYVDKNLQCSVDESHPKSKSSEYCSICGSKMEKFYIRGTIDVDSALNNVKSSYAPSKYQILYTAISGAILVVYYILSIETNIQQHQKEG